MRRVLHALFAGLCMVIASAASAATADLFAGCDTDERAPATAGGSPRERKEPKVDRITQRSFASFSMADIEQGLPRDMTSLCWARLDGVWRDETRVTLDRKLDDANVWASDTPQLVSLANGNYTSARFVVIEPSDAPERLLRMTTGMNGRDFATFVSDDGVTLEAVLRQSGAVKTYTTQDRFAFGRRLTVDVTRSGRLRLRFDGRAFLRPQPGVSRAAMSAQLPADDAFLLSYNLDNLAASRRGYDPVRQDPFYLLQNNKLEVFAEVDPRNYFITEKRTVPIGFSLVQEQAQGYVFRKKLISSETEVQQTMAHSYGANLVFGDMEGSAVKASAGFSASKASTEALRNSQSVAQAVGYSRAKKYALVVDHPYVTLSEDFIDAVEDARRYHRYQALIDKFGTHYAYAVTYGAMARMTQSFSSEEFIERAQKDSSFAQNAGATVYGAGGDVRSSTDMSEIKSNAGSVGSEGATFVGVGGNGSWDQNGFSAGDTPVPILLDLRPLSQLLNPMNFPDEPEVYTRVRRNLERAISRHAGSLYRPLLADSWLPPVPEPVLPKDEVKPHEEVWYAYVRSAWCVGGPIEAAKIKQVRGSITISAGGGSKTRKMNLGALCKNKRKTETYDYAAGDRGLLVLKGTRAEVARKAVHFDYEYQMLPWKKTHKVDKRFPPSVLKSGLAVGKSSSYDWKIVRKGLPDVFLKLRLKRIR